MQGEVISNRLHRSGAIDHNATFNIRQAQVQNAKKGVHGKKFWSQTEHADAFSVCEGEPCFTVSNKKQKPLADNRNPIALLSSLNGFCPSNSQQISTAIRECATADVAEEMEQLRAYHNLRNEFFKEICYTSTSVSKFDYGSIGRKGEQFVATMGGLNTIYADTPLAAGDVIVVDIPAFDAESLENTQRLATADCDAPDCKQYGLVTWKQKKGVPKSKRTLVIRSIPAMPLIRGSTAQDNELRDAYETFRQGFLARGQVVGKCVKAASAGERIDLVHVGNAIGIWNSCCNNFPLV